MNEEQDLRRLQCLFEGCAAVTVNHKLDLSKDDAGAFVSEETQQLFSLWLAGHNQGVVDHAFARGDIQL